jgi:hypothetical protein
MLVHAGALAGLKGKDCGRNDGFADGIFDILTEDRL